MDPVLPMASVLPETRFVEGLRMPAFRIYQCQCPACLSEAADDTQEQHRAMNLFLSRLDEQQRRWYVGLYSLQMAHIPDTMLSRITGMDEKTIRRGRREIQQEFKGRPVQGTRLPGGGRPTLEEKIHR